MKTETTNKVNCMRPSNYRIGVDEKGIYALDRRTGETVRNKLFLAYFFPVQEESSASYQAPESVRKISLLDESEAFGSLLRSNGRVSDR